MIQKKVNLFRIIPLIIFFSLILLAFIALKTYDKDNIPSVLIGQSPPPLLLEELGNFKLIDKRDLKPIKENKIRLINFWASWCPPCRVEHPQLEKLSKKKNIQLFGVNYKDSENSALNFLNDDKNEYSKSPFKSEIEDIDGLVELSKYAPPLGSQNACNRLGRDGLVGFRRGV